MRSDNNATISLASMVGFDRVAALARSAGIKNAQGIPVSVPVWYWKNRNIERAA